jgi:ribosomal protein S18 acetylase RimI-like enzyme
VVLRVARVRAALDVGALRFARDAAYLVYARQGFAILGTTVGRSEIELHPALRRDVDGRPDGQLPPPCHGHGIGRALLEDRIRATRAAGLRCAVLDVAVTNPRAQALYERVGFRARSSGLTPTRWMNRASFPGDGLSSIGR